MNIDGTWWSQRGVGNSMQPSPHYFGYLLITNADDCTGDENIEHKLELTLQLRM